MADNLTLMAVHAHPDDEASSTGGVLARYGAEGVRTVVVTCTNGEFGDAPGGIKPGDDGHGEGEVAEIRLAELRESAKHLGVTDLELLGYHDSGMAEWDYKSRPDRIGGLIERFRPQVVVTYDPDGAYQHPDHVHASRAAIEAVTRTGIPAKLYLAAMPVSKWRELWTALKEAGVDVPGDDRITPEEQQQMEAAEQRITTTVDIRPVLARKRAALLAHASQISESWFSKIPPELGERVFGEESFIREMDRTGAPLPEDDLFAGLR
jgi:LmbE family N-acetylglucosaminyl deacetylase